MKKEYQNMEAEHWEVSGPVDQFTRKRKIIESPEKSNLQEYHVEAAGLIQSPASSWRDVVTLTTKLKTLQERHEMLRIDYDTKQNTYELTVADQAKSLSNLKQQLQTLQDSDTPSTHQPTSRKINELEATIKDLNKVKKGSEDEFKAKKEEILARLDRTEQQLEEAKAENEVYQQQTEELDDQINTIRKQLGSARKNCQLLNSTKFNLEKARNKIKELENQVETAKVSNSLLPFSEANNKETIERDIRLLKEENTKLKQQNSSNALLEEELLSLQNVKALTVGLKEELTKAHSDSTVYNTKMNDWVDMVKSLIIDDTTFNTPTPTPSTLQDYIQNLQREVMMAKTGVSSSERLLEQTKLQLELLTTEHTQARTSLKASEVATKELTQSLEGCRVDLNRAKQMQQTYKKFMDSYDQEASVQKHDTIRVARIEELEKRLADKENTYSSSESSSKNNEDINKIAKINKLEKQLSQKTAQVDSCKAKLAQLEKHCEKAEQEASVMQEKLGRGEYNPATTKILHFSMNPTKQAVAQSKQAKLLSVQKENKLLREQLERLQTQINDNNADEKNSNKASHLGQPQSQQHAEEIKKLRKFKQMAYAKVSEFRETSYRLTGYKLEMLPPQGNNSVFKLMSMYAEKADDHLLFCDTPEGLQVMQTDFCKGLDSSVLDVLKRFHSIPAFLAQTQLHLFEKQTRM